MSGIIDLYCQSVAIIIEASNYNSVFCQIYVYLCLLALQYQIQLAIRMFFSTQQDDLVIITC